MTVRPLTLLTHARRRADALRQGAREAVRAQVPATVALQVPIGDVSQRRARAAVALGLRIGEALLSSSASASDVVATVLRVLHAYGVTNCHVDVTYTSITASVYRGEDEDPLAMMRVVRGRGYDYTKLQLIHELVRSITESGMPHDAARARFDQITTAPRTYRRGIVTACNGLMGAAVALLFGAGPVVVLIALVTGLVVSEVQHHMAKRGIAALFTQAAAGVIPTLAAVGLYALQADVRWGIAPSLIVVAGIIVALAGLGVVGAAQDAIDGFYVTASARSFEVVLLTTGIVVGIAATLLVAAKMGVPMAISPYTSATPDPVFQVLCATLVGLTFAVSAHTGPRASIVAAGMAAASMALFLAATGAALGPVTSSAVAAAGVGVASQALARWVRVPAQCLSTAGIISLLPGLAVYRGLWQLTNPDQDPALGIGTLLVAFSTGLALAAGVSAGTFLARPWVTRDDIWRRLVLRRSVGREVDDRGRRAAGPRP